MKPHKEQYINLLESTESLFKKASASNIKQIMDRITNTHPEYKDFTDSLVHLIDLNKKLYDNIVQLSNNMISLSNHIENNSEAIYNIQNDLKSKKIIGKETF